MSNPLFQRLRKLLRSLFVDTPSARPIDLGGRKIIVTGASPGSIGFATACTLARWGADVVITTRSNPEAAAVAIRAALSPKTQGRIAGHALDLGDASSVEQFARWYRETQGERLDVLINNAGIHLDLLSQWKQPRLSADGHEIQWRTNFLGTFHLTDRLLPLLLKSAQTTGDARVVNVVSMLHARGNNAALFEPPQPYNSWVAYGTSKLALIHATVELQRRYGAAGLKAYCLHPGAVFSNIASKGLAGNRALLALRRALAPIEALFLLSVEEGAQTQVHCATALDAEPGRYYRDCRRATPSADAEDSVVATKLWEAGQSWLRSL